MTTIPQRLRTWADRIQADDHMEYTELAEEIRLAAAELEAHDPAPVQENRHGSVAFQYLREEVARAMAPVHAAFDERAKAENPAADAVPVVAQASTAVEKRDGFEVPHLFWFSAVGRLKPGDYLVRQRDHIAAIASEREHAGSIAALQARINELESRQVAIFEAVDRLGSARSFLNGYILSSGCILNNMEGTVQKWIDGLSALYRLEDEASTRRNDGDDETHSDTSKERP